MSAVPTAPPTPSQTELEGSRTRTPRAQGRPDYQLIGDSPAVQSVRDLLSKAASIDVTVLLQGESGTGKEVAAHRIHSDSDRAGGPMVAINCGAIPEGLLESELFGHEKGAFTGAVRCKPGLFELANGGTIFLDEIGDLRLDLQVRLLRVLQSREIQRIGSDQPRPIDVRVIAATHRDLARSVAENRFREDLYYRLAVFPIQMPPLRECGADVLLLARSFVRRFADKHGRSCRTLDPNTEAALLGYTWPGNVRQLENVIERAVIFETEATVRQASLHRALSLGQPAAPAEPAAPPPATASAGPDSIRPLEEVERDAIRHALEQTGWNIQEAARRLQIGRATIYRKMERYDLTSRRDRGGSGFGRIEPGGGGI